MWLRIFKHLLPKARAWKLTPDKTLRNFFSGLSGIGEDVKVFYDDIFDDIDPQKTRQLAEFESQFALQDAGLTEQERRDRLSAAWKARGGQSPGYIQNTLQAAGFDVYVHEWWEPDPLHPTGGSVDGDVVPVARVPFDFIDDGSVGVRYLMNEGDVDSQDGDTIAQDGSTSAPPGYLLVNKPIVSTIPADTTKYPYFLYIGGQTFPGVAAIPTSRRDEFETLCLKICPTEQWLGILVTYS